MATLTRVLPSISSTSPGSSAPASFSGGEVARCVPSGRTSDRYFASLPPSQANSQSIVPFLRPGKCRDDSRVYLRRLPPALPAFAPGIRGGLQARNHHHADNVAGEALDLPHEMPVVVAEEGHRDARASRTPRAADAVHVVLRLARR